ncbi:MAG: hypothetical protein IJM87_00400 [Ruminococcus sp.]|nr:hypothetical protein [Ruminococcus sp.]
MRLGFKALVLTAALAVTGLFSGCAGINDPKGADLILDARKAYAELDSARVIMTNTETGEVDQEFTFKYDEKDVCVFSYYGKNGDDVYAQFNNGVEDMKYENGKYTHTVRGEKSFNQYTRNAKHPQADEGLLVYTPTAVKKAEKTEQDGEIRVKYEYDLKKLGADIEGIKATGFETEYCFEKDGELKWFTETTFSKDKTYCYKIEITERNSVDKVENTVKEHNLDKD